RLFAVFTTTGFIRTQPHLISHQLLLTTCRLRAPRRATTSFRALTEGPYCVHQQNL
ncbi:hypothetical protein XENOCAPTIV_020413, partial [Xenoophorus captivus]